MSSPPRCISPPLLSPLISPLDTSMRLFSRATIRQGTPGGMLVFVSKKFLAWIAIFVFLFYIVKMIRMPWKVRQFQYQLIDFSYAYPKSEQDTRPPKQVLLWDYFFLTDMAGVLNKKQCEYTCQYYHRGGLDAADADAIIFHMRSFLYFFKHIPHVRRPEQYYIAYEREPPHFVGEGARWVPGDFFNATMGYKMDPRTYYLGYGRVKKAITPFENSRLTPVSDEEFEEIYARKIGMTYIMVSNCVLVPSKRDEYAVELADYINMTVVGGCDDLFTNNATTTRKECERTDDNCDVNMSRDHFFNVAFENSVCSSYTSEKYYRNEFDTVPIVLRRSIARQSVPEGSFIAADDFNSPRELAEYLKMVAANKTLYREYFRWRDEYYFADRSEGLCQLCRDLHFNNVTRLDRPILEYYTLDQCELKGARNIMEHKWPPQTVRERLFPKRYKEQVHTHNNSITTRSTFFSLF